MAQRLRALDQRVVGRVQNQPRRLRHILLLVAACTALAALINLAVAIVEPGFLTILLTVAFSLTTVTILLNTRRLGQAGPSPGTS